MTAPPEMRHHINEFANAYHLTGLLRKRAQRMEHTFAAFQTRVARYLSIYADKLGWLAGCRRYPSGKTALR